MNVISSHAPDPHDFGDLGEVVAEGGATDDGCPLRIGRSSQSGDGRPPPPRVVRSVAGDERLPNLGFALEKNPAKLAAEGSVSTFNPAPVVFPLLRHHEPAFVKDSLPSRGDGPRWRSPTIQRFGPDFKEKGAVLRKSGQ